MKFKVNVSKQADSDLRSIYEYIAFTLKSPSNAVRQLDRLEKKIFGLDEYPERFQQYQREPWKSRGLRFMVVNHYIVFYIPNLEKKVGILRIMYGGRDIDTQLKEYTRNSN